MEQPKFFDNMSEDMLKQWHYYFSVLQPQSGDSILDVGCGLGDADKGLLMAYPTLRKVVGVDVIEQRIQTCLAKWQDDGRPAKLEFKQADAQNLPFSNETFDRVFSVDTLEWVFDPAKALREMLRVIKPGGVALIAHSDFDSQVFNAADRQLNRKIVHSFSDAGPNGQIGRELFGLCRSAGFTRVRPLVYTLVNTVWKPEMYACRTAHMMRDWLLEKAAVSGEEIERWLADLAAQSAGGKFFYTINRNICFCEK
jgi:ubiquinone/menaquinone biosynthesis C-methylase UbiE